MLVLLEGKVEIREAQTALKRTLAQDLNRKATTTIGFPGDNIPDATVIHDGHHWFWSDVHKEGPNPRFLNWFGIFDQDRAQQITVEVNVPLWGRNDNVAGSFARDTETGIVYLTHSGRVGGGKAGVSKLAFLASANPALQDVYTASGDFQRAVVVLTPVNGPKIANYAIKYVTSVAKFKKDVRANNIDFRELQTNEKLLSVCPGTNWFN
jgi:hypothetical protein